MKSDVSSPWVGNAATSGERVCLDHCELRSGTFVLGIGASEMATTISFACDEAGLRTLVLDLDGYASERISGSIPAFSPSAFLYETMKMGGENSGLQAQLLASAYSIALDLSFEQEAALDSVCQRLALEEGVASPVALAERMDSQESGGSANRRLRGRLNALSALSAVGGGGVFSKIVEGSVLMDFRESPTPEAAELSAALVMARLVASVGGSPEDVPDVVVLVQANRLFKERPIFRQNLRLLSAFFSSPFGKVLASEVRFALDRRIIEASPVRILSSDVWNDPRRTRVLAPGMFAIVKAPKGSEELFLPRECEYVRGDVQKGGRIGSPPGLALEILEAISTFGDSTRRSLVAYLSTGRSTSDVEREVDLLLDGGLIQTASKRLRRDSPHLVLKLTAKGEQRLKGGA